MHPTTYYRIHLPLEHQLLHEYVHLDMTMQHLASICGVGVVAQPSQKHHQVYIGGSRGGPPHWLGIENWI
jgi:hypothetical protein